jgi:hypothetical protein
MVQVWGLPPLPSNDRILILPPPAVAVVFLSLHGLEIPETLELRGQDVSVWKAQEGFRMITVSQEQLAAVEYLIKQSTQGNHVLFDLDTVRRVFTVKTQPMNEDQIREVENHIERLISLGTLEKQKSYVQNLPEEVLYRVIKTYFNIVENNLFENTAVRH